MPGARREYAWQRVEPRTRFGGAGPRRLPRGRLGAKVSRLPWRRGLHPGRAPVARLSRRFRCRVRRTGLPRHRRRRCGRGPLLPIGGRRGKPPPPPARHMPPARDGAVPLPLASLPLAPRPSRSRRPRLWCVRPSPSGGRPSRPGLASPEMPPRAAPLARAAPLVRPPCVVRWASVPPQSWRLPPAPLCTRVQPPSPPVPGPASPLGLPPAPGPRHPRRPRRPPPCASPSRPPSPSAFPSRRLSRRRRGQPCPVPCAAGPGQGVRMRPGWRPSCGRASPPSACVW